jgi:hypothetical protein
MISPSFTLRDAALALDVPTTRLLRLGRYLRIPSSEACLPPDVVIQAGLESDADDRYRVILHWLTEATAVASVAQ